MSDIINFENFIKFAEQKPIDERVLSTLEYFTKIFRKQDKSCLDRYFNLYKTNNRVKAAYIKNLNNFKNIVLSQTGLNYLEHFEKDTFLVPIKPELKSYASIVIDPRDTIIADLKAENLKLRAELNLYKLNLNIAPNKSSDLIDLLQ